MSSDSLQGFQILIFYQHLFIFTISQLLYCFQRPIDCNRFWFIPKIFLVLTRHLPPPAYSRCQIATLPRPIMDHVFFKQSCGNYVSIANVGKTVASSGEGRARCWKYFKIKASDRIWKIQFTEKRLPESSTPQHMRYLNKTPRFLSLSSYEGFNVCI